MQLGMTRRCLGRSTAAAKEEEEEKMRLKQVNNACSLFLNRSFPSFPDNNVLSKFQGGDCGENVECSGNWWRTRTRMRRKRRS